MVVHADSEHSNQTGRSAHFILSVVMHCQSNPILLVNYLPFFLKKIFFVYSIISLCCSYTSANIVTNEENDRNWAIRTTIRKNDMNGQRKNDTL